jgi:hypothetical protein
MTVFVDIDGSSPPMSGGYPLLYTSIGRSRGMLEV